MNDLIHAKVSMELKICRAKAVRLIANKLLPEIMLTAAIEEFAIKELRKLTQLGSDKRPKADPQGSMRQAKPEPATASQSGGDDGSTGNALKRQRSEEPDSAAIDTTKHSTQAVKNEEGSKKQRLDGAGTSADQPSRSQQLNGAIKGRNSGRGLDSPHLMEHSHISTTYNAPSIEEVDHNEQAGQ